MRTHKQPDRVRPVQGKFSLTHVFTPAWEWNRVSLHSNRLKTDKCYIKLRLRPPVRDPQQESVAEGNPFCDNGSVQNELLRTANQSDPESSALTLQELAALVGFTPRYIKHLIQRGILSRPEGATRAARYSATHVKELLEIQRLRDAGWSITQIQAKLRARTAHPNSVGRTTLVPTVQRRYVLLPGVELVFSADQSRDEDLIVARCIEVVSGTGHGLSGEGVRPDSSDRRRQNLPGAQGATPVEPVR